MLFGKKKEQKQVEEQAHPAVDDLMKRISALENIPEAAPSAQIARPIPMMQSAMPEQMPTKVILPQPARQEQEEEKPSFAPLFVKIDRYRQILSTINNLRNTLMLLKNNFMILNELEKLKEDNMSLIKETLEKMEKRMSSLDTQFMRPSGFMEDTENVQDLGTDATLADLSGQVEDLRAQLQSLS